MPAEFTKQFPYDQPPLQLHQCGPSHDLLASLGGTYQNIPFQSQKWPRLRKLASSKPLSACRDCEERDATADALAKCPEQALCSPQGTLFSAKQRLKEETKTGIQYDSACKEL